MDVLDLFFRRLVLAARAAGALDRPLEVGEVLDSLVPYGSARRDGLIDSNDDYLHVAMRLVSGERELVFADDLMQDDLRAELGSPNPDVSVLRTYANAKMRISTEGVQRVLAGDTEIDLHPPTPLRPTTAVQPIPVAAPIISTDTPSTGCPYCAQALPEGRTLKYCPSCGQNLVIRRCPGCSSEIESEWKFCVTCGRKGT